MDLFFHHSMNYYNHIDFQRKLSQSPSQEIIRWCKSSAHSGKHDSKITHNCTAYNLQNDGRVPTAKVVQFLHLRTRSSVYRAIYRTVDRVQRSKNISRIHNTENPSAMINHRAQTTTNHTKRRLIRPSYERVHRKTRGKGAHFLNIIDG